MRELITGLSESELEHCIREYYHVLEKYLARYGFSKMEMEDVLQEAVSAAYFNRDSLRDKEKLEPWLKKIAYNMVCQHFRREKRGVILSADVEGLIEAKALSQQLCESDGFAIMQEMEEYQELKQKFECLGGRHKEIMELCYLQDCSLRQAANILDIKYNTAKTIHARALKKLKTKHMTRSSGYYDGDATKA